MAGTGENEVALRKIMDMTRLMAVVILIIHIYYFCYGAFVAWQLTMEFTDKLLGNISNTGILDNFHTSKLWALGLLLISLIGVRGKKDEKLTYKPAVAYIVTGLFLYFCAFLVLYIDSDQRLLTLIYSVLTGTGFLFVLSGGTLLTRILKNSLNNGDIFNNENETFPQEERLLVNEHSINIRARYRLKNKYRESFLNFIAPYRSVILSGTAGAGKTAFVVREIIKQALSKGSDGQQGHTPYTMFVYDFKFPDLSTIAYNYWLQNKHLYKGKPECFFINFDDLSRTHRGNVFDPMGMIDITDATDSARTFLLGLNKEWQKKTGDFFVESGINFLTAIIWYLRKFQDGAFCTLPHCIELIQTDYDSLFTLLSQEPEISVLVNPFISAYKADVMPQLEGQIASTKIALARLASPQLYYVLSGKDFSLDINNPENPKLICMGNNPQKTNIYGAVLSLYINRMLKIINQKGKEKSMLIFEEFPTLSTDVIPTITTGRSNLISTVLVVQDVSQLRKEYGREQADVIVNTVGNVISGQVTGDSAKQFSERIGKIMQDRQSLSINSNDTSISKNKQLDYAVPASKISALSSGEFVGVLSDLPDQKIPQKAFHCQIHADFKAITAEEKNFKTIPVIREVTPEIVQRNYMRIKEDIQNIIQTEIERLLLDPAKRHMVIKKNN